MDADVDMGVSSADVENLLFAKVLLDPSCSGSGMLRQKFTEDGENEERLDSLFRFQLSALRKAFTFPQVWVVSS